MAYLLYSRSERQLYLFSAESLASGSVASAPADVSPSTLIPFYDPDTSVLILTGKVCECVSLLSIKIGHWFIVTNRFMQQCVYLSFGLSG